MDSVERKMISIDLIDENPDNPNKMTARQFDLLVNNVQENGLTENIVVRPVEDRFRIVSGHHRFKAALFLGYSEVPCAVITDQNFTEELESFQLIRMNMIKGQLDPQAFINMYQKFAGKYGDDALQELFGFADDAMFKRLITQTAKALPKEMQAKFKEAAKEIDTIDGLSKLLNQMFTKHGDTLPYGYMVVDYGKQHSVWLRVEKKTFDALQLIGDFCVEQSVTMDDVVGGVVQAIARGEASDLIEPILESAPKVVVTGLGVMPTKDHLAAAEALGG